MESHNTYWAAAALLEWHLELGATCAMSEAPVDRYAEAARDLAAKQAKKQSSKPPHAPNMAAVKAPKSNPQEDLKRKTEQVKALATSAQTLAELKTQIEKCQLCEERKGARNTVFAAGNPNAPIMVLLDPPRKDEDQYAAPITGQDAALFQQMFQAIDLNADLSDQNTSLYVVPALPWRTLIPGEANLDYMSIMTPFLQRDIALIQPKLIVIMGEVALQMLSDHKMLRRAHGEWLEVEGRPALPIYPPQTLQTIPQRKREAWHALLKLKAKYSAL